MKSVFSPEKRGKTSSDNVDDSRKLDQGDEVKKDINDMDDDIPIRTRRITKDYKLKPELERKPPVARLNSFDDKFEIKERARTPLKKEEAVKSNTALKKITSMCSIHSRLVPCLSSNLSLSEDTYKEVLFDIESSEDKNKSLVNAESRSVQPLLLKKISSDVLNEMALQRREQPILNLDHLELLELLGKGSFAKVYKAWYKPDGIYVALKIFEYDEDEQKRREIIRDAENEAKILEKLERNLKHKNILKLKSISEKVGDANNLIIMTLEYGLCSMHDILQERPCYQEGEIIYILLDILDALAKSQLIGIANRDIKPKNLILSEEMNSYRVADFGVAVDLGQEKEISYDDVAGTPLYIAPELSANLIVHVNTDKKVVSVKPLEKKTYDPWKADVYSLGITVLQMMGLNNDSVKKVKGRKNVQDVDLPELRNYSLDFLEIVNCLLCKDPNDRLSFEAALLRFFELASKKKSFDDEKYYRKWVEKIREERTTPSSIAYWQNIADTYFKVGIFYKNLEIRTIIFQLYSKHYQDGISNDLANAIQNLGYAYDIIGDSEKAIIYYEKGLAMKKLLLGDKASIQISSLLKDIGLAYVKIGESRKAIEYFEKCLSFEQELKSEQNESEINFSMAYTLANMALAHVNLGDNHKAINYYEQSADLYSLFEVEGRILYDFASLMSNIGIAYVNLGLWENGIEVYEKSMEIFEQFYGTNNHPSVANTLNNCGVAYEKMGKTKKAMELYEKSIEIHKKFHGTSAYSPAYANTLCNLATSHLNQGNTTEAKTLYETIIDLYIKNNKNLVHPGVGNIYSQMGIAYAHSGQNNKAIEYYQKSLDIYNQIYKKIDHPAVVNTMCNMGLVHVNTGDYDKAIDIYDQSLKIYQNLYKNEYHPSVANLYSNMGIVLDKKGDSFQAVCYYEKSIEINKQVFSTDKHPAIGKFVSNIQGVGLKMFLLMRFLKKEENLAKIK